MLRQRNVRQADGRTESSSVSSNGEEENKGMESNKSTQQDAVKLSDNSYWLTRIIILRYVAFIYFVAFLVALHQNEALIGNNGLLPAKLYLKNLRQRAGNSVWSQLLQCPSVLVFCSDDSINFMLGMISGAGLVLSGVVLVTGAANVPVMLILWAMYHSIVNVGQQWYWFGWESQLLETGFLAAFLCPFWKLSRLPEDCPTSKVVLWGFRWLIFRIMLGAGLIKIRGDKCWRDLTCMNYHYETQPVPNPVSYYMHQEPELFHQFETLTNHFVELVAPVLILLTRRLRIIGGAIQILFQIVLIISGNLSFLNWLTITPCLACFDDRSLQWLFSDKSRRRVAYLHRQDTDPAYKRHVWGQYTRRAFNTSLGLMLAYLSIPIVQNLMSSRQLMNTSFDPLRIVNTYGAFGSITKQRTEVIFQGTSAANPSQSDAVWLEYEFKCKPGNVTRRPCIISPYHYRLDWLMWFAAFQNYDMNPWLVHLGAKLLENDVGALSLIEYNPFNGGDPPRWIRAEHYHYQFTKVGSKEARQGAWWTRKRIGNYMPPISTDSMRDVMTKMGWKSRLR